MRYNSRRNRIRVLFFSSALLALAATGETLSPLPCGLMLNLDLQNEKNGLIPNKALYPLYVPLNGLSIENINHRNILQLQYGQGLDIPHSALLDPDGREWVVSVRIFALTDGLVLSQADNENGYAIYLKDGAAHAVIKSGPSALTLEEKPEQGITDCTKTWATITLQIKPDMAIMSINRKRVALVRLSEPFAGTKQLIRLGNHTALPAPFRFKPNLTPTGFTGGLSSFKIHRQ